MPVKRSAKKKNEKKKKPVWRGTAKAGGKRWSGEVTLHSDALDLDSGVFTWRDPKRIARSLRDSAEQSRRRKASAFQSAMSMLTFYINRGGRNLTAAQRKILNQAKVELRRLYGRETE
ncbi:MAG TPA: DUF3175 domain-containing protein [Alphaproteobacteria bacterium]|nr:DUF3175 domain-containing protein [Alphaproteobacteria bacterium]